MLCNNYKYHAIFWLHMVVQYIFLLTVNYWWEGGGGVWFSFGGGGLFFNCN